MHYFNSLSERIYSPTRNQEKEIAQQKEIINSLQSPPPKRARKIKRDEIDNVNSVFIVEQHGDHIYEVEEKTLASRCTPVKACNHCLKLNSKGMT